MAESTSKQKLDDLASEVLKARERTQKYVRKTPLLHSPFLSQNGQCYIKLGKSFHNKKTFQAGHYRSLLAHQRNGI